MLLAEFERTVDEVGVIAIAVAVAVVVIVVKDVKLAISLWMEGQVQV